MADQSLRLERAIAIRDEMGSNVVLARRMTEIRGRDVAPDYVSRMLNTKSPQHKGVSDEMARLIERAAGKPKFWLDGIDLPPPPPPPPPAERDIVTVQGVRTSLRWLIVASELKKLDDVPELQQLLEVMIHTLVAAHARNELQPLLAQVRERPSENAAPVPAPKRKRASGARATT